MRSPAALTAALLISLAVKASAQPSASVEATGGPSHPFLEKVFKSDLSPEQMSALGPSGRPEQAIALMTPEQRAAAQQRLMAAEVSARTPRQKKEIARGYLMLNEHAPNAGVDALRIAAELRRQNPRDPETYTIASGALFQQGDYEDSYKSALAALTLDPRDQAAHALLRLSQDRRRGMSANAHPPAQGEAAPTIKAVAEPPSSAQERAPFKPVVRTGKYKPVPALFAGQQAIPPLPSVTQRATGVVDKQIERVLDVLDPQEHLTAENRATVVRNTKGAAVAGGVVGGVVIGTTGLGGCGAAQVYGVPYPVCVPLVALGGVAAGSFTGSFFIGSGTYIYLRAKQQWQDLMGKP